MNFSCEACKPVGCSELIPLAREIEELVVAGENIVERRILSGQPF
jgi:hypothetical protein